MNARVIRRGALGDVLCAEPFMRALRLSGRFDRVFAECGPYNPVFENHPLIETGPPEQPFLTIDLTGAYEQQMPCAITRAYFDAFRLPTEEFDLWPRLYTTREERNAAWERLTPVPPLSLRREKWVLLDMSYPEGPYGRGFWPSEDWVPVTEAIRAAGYRLLAVPSGTSANTPITFPVDCLLHSCTTLREFFALVACCSLVVGVDGGPIHVAQALHVPGIGIFNPRHPASMVLAKGSCILPLHMAKGQAFDADAVIAALEELVAA